MVRIIKEVGDVKDTLERDLGSLQKSLHDDIGMMRLGPKTGQVTQGDLALAFLPPPQATPGRTSDAVGKMVARKMQKC